MPDTALENIISTTTLAETDLLYAVKNPATTPLSRKLTLAALRVILGPVDVASYKTGGSGTSGDPWTGWDTAITWTADTEYRFRSGYYAYATSPNFLVSGIALRGEAGTVLKHTGTGNAVEFLNASGWTQNVRFENFIILGNSNTTNGLFLRGVRNGIFSHISIRGAAAAGIRTEACVTNLLYNFRCTHHEPTQGGSFAVTPVNGIVFDKRTVDSAQSTTWTVINPIIEGVSGDGIYFPASGTFFNTFIGGTSEGNGLFGLKIVGSNTQNQFIGVDFEVNGGVRSSAWGQTTNNGDIYDESANTYLGCNSSGFAEFWGPCIVTSGNFADYKAFDRGLFFNTRRTASAIYSADSRAMACRDSAAALDPEQFQPNALTWTAPSIAAAGTYTPSTTLVAAHLIAMPAGNITIANPTGTPLNFQKMLFRIRQDAVGGRTITWGNKYKGTLPATSAAASDRTYYEFAYNSTDDRWDLQYTTPVPN